MTSRCERYVRSLSKVRGVPYSKVRKDFPRGPYAKSVYTPSGEVVEHTHCIHCARAEALMDYKTGDYR
jgi:hypothetical protein